MDSVDMEVIRSAAQWLEQGFHPVLVTVVRTWGAAPRPAGSLLVIRDDGRLTGSVSGGCIEDDLIARMQQADLHRGEPRTLRYGAGADDAHRFGLPCGGTVELVVEPLHASSGMRELLDALTARQPVARTLDLQTGRVTLRAAVAADRLEFDAQRLQTLFGPRYRMLVIGAGQLSRPLCQIALGLDYRVTVCDPRPEHADTWDLPGTMLVRTMPDDAVLAMQPDAHCAVIAMTHDPRLDDLALMEALKFPAFYVGALGSLRNNAQRRERLREFDLAPAQLERLHGPAGIDIGSRTPPEIAISILAEITAAKNGIVIPSSPRAGAAKPGP